MMMMMMIMNILILIIYLYFDYYLKCFRYNYIVIVQVFFKLLPKCKNNVKCQ